MSFEEVREVLVSAYTVGYLDDREFLTLYEYYEPTNRSFPYWDFDAFCLEDFTSSKCEANFVVAKDDLLMLKDAPQIPETSKCPQGTMCDGLEGLCLLLKRLAYLCRYFDLMYTFARPVPTLYAIEHYI